MNEVSEAPHDRLAAELRGFGPVGILAILIIFAGNLVVIPLGGLLVHRFARRLALEVMTEVVSVARAENVRLEKVSGTLDLGFIALTDADRRSVGSPSLLAKHAVLLAVGARYRRMRSSMLSAIERGREPAIDFLNGEVVERGKRHEIPTPVNEAAADAVRALAAGRMVAGLDTVRALERLLD